MEFLFSVKSSVPFCFCWETVWMMTLCTPVLGRANERLSFLKLGISVWRIYREREVFKGEGKQCALSFGRVIGMRCWLCCGTIHRCLVACHCLTVWPGDMPGNWNLRFFGRVTPSDWFVLSDSTLRNAQIVSKHSASSVFCFILTFSCYIILPFSLLFKQMFDMWVS